MDARAEALSDTIPIRADEDFDHGRLAAYLRGKIPGAEGPMEVTQFQGGHSNLTYLARFGDREYVVRRPPLGPVAPKAHDMGREFGVLSRLYQAFPKAPRAYLFCEDASVLGAPFVVLERMQGLVVRNVWPPQLGDDPALRRRISESLVDTLAELHKVDYAAIGLGGFGKPEGFLERQVTGWAERWQRSKTEEIPWVEDLVKEFSRRMPASRYATLLHNDFKLDNAMLAHDDPGRVIGVFDWEMSTLGDPLVDLGITLGYWGPREGLKSPPIGVERRVTPSLMPGFMTHDEVVERYAGATGFDVSGITYYEAFAWYKTAVVLQQIYVRFHRGQTQDARFAELGKQVGPMMERARGLLERAG